MVLLRISSQHSTLQSTFAHCSGHPVGRVHVEQLLVHRHQIEHEHGVHVHKARLRQPICGEVAGATTWDLVLGAARASSRSQEAAGDVKVSRLNLLVDLDGGGGAPDE